ncbi:cellulose biosynthesis protein BcsQ [Pseudomonas sp. SL4(2022)]|uniref:cellulose biosynthesis protein BcsQ n=1 Tax=unclassified Pseudomonas TaxID=196821 RepID=UPI001C48978C|nr:MULTISPECIES: cellulose biosynthesis protein BcsQ [unclassified Pseudomonas]WAC43544.1 cellulose biosynthesis protein BcsQ [Pseudomonas sp. SL4(2022)]
MSTSSDISSLFKLFGGRSAHYQEISQEDEKQSSKERWPGVAKVELSSVPAAEPAASPQVAAVVRPALFAGAIVQPPPVLAPEPAPEPSMPVAGAAAGPDWAAESLQSLLGKLAQEDRREVVSTPVRAARPRPHLDNIKVVAVISAKGGVGKSTLAAGLSSVMQRQGRAVLAIDLDPQSALSNHLGVAIDPMQVAAEGLAHCVADVQMRDFCQPTPSGVFVLPYGIVDEDQRRAFERQLEDEPDWLAQQLSELQLADGSVVVLDTPPGPSVYLQQALSVANVAVVVSLADAASYATLPMIDRLLATYTAEREDFYGATYVINQVDQSRKLSKDITQIMRGILGSRVAGIIHRDQSIAEALAYSQSVLDYDPSGQGCHDLQAIALNVLAKLFATQRSEQLA